jgi:hypothetical protein
MLWNFSSHLQPNSTCSHWEILLEVILFLTDCKGKLSLHNPQSPIVRRSPKYCHLLPWACAHSPNLLDAVMVPSISYNMQLCPIKLAAAALWHGQPIHEAYSRQDWLRNFFEKQLPLKWAMPITVVAPSPFCCRLATSSSEYSQTETAGNVQNLLTSLTDICKGSRLVWSPPIQQKKKQERYRRLYVPKSQVPLL